MIITIWILVICLIYWKHYLGIKALPEHLKYKWHNDYTFPLCFIPRSLTAYNFNQPPKTIWKYNCVGLTYYNDRFGINPIQNKLNGKFCSWHFNFPQIFFSITFKWGWYFIIGFRWDAVDFYYNFLTIDISYAENFAK